MTDDVFVFPASYAQQRLYFLQNLAPNSPFYNVEIALLLSGNLNFSALYHALNTIISRHEILRTTFRLLDGELVQIIVPTLTIPLPITNISAVSNSLETATEIAKKEAAEIFDLNKGPLLRSHLLKLAENDHILLLNLHHIITDGWSMGILIKELGILYSGGILPEIPLQYADYTEWQKQWLTTDRLNQQLSYWLTKLDGVSILNLPTDRKRQPIPTYKGNCQNFALSSSLTQALINLSKQQNVTLYMTLLAAFKLLLYRYTQQEDIVIGGAIANRNRQEIEGLIGFFVNSLVFRTNLAGNPTFVELLERVKNVTLEAYANQDVPFEKIVEKLGLKRDLSTNPLFQVSFSLQNTPIQPLNLPEINISLLEFDTGISKLDLEFNLWEEGEIIKGKVFYSSDLFDDATIARMLGHYQILLEAIKNNANAPIASYPILSEAERKQILFTWNDTQKTNPPKTFPTLFEEIVKKYPKTIALVFGNKSLTYQQLNHKANQLAHHLQTLGVGPEVVVGVYLQNSIEAIIGFLAILKAGGVYLPLDPASGSDRLAFILQDAQACIILTHTKYLERLPQLDNLICLDKPLPNLLCHPAAEGTRRVRREGSPNPHLSPPCLINLGNTAYIIYTSGSTGQPKGVLITHRGLTNLKLAQTEIFNPQKGDPKGSAQRAARHLQFASLCFDASIFEIVLALSHGSSLYIITKELHHLQEFLQKKKITHVTLTPSVLSILSPESLPALHTVIAAGENCPLEVAQKWAKNRSFYNAYGPTEATVWSTIAPITDTLSIGRPIRNTRAYILDRHLQPLPIGVPGLLYLAGEGLARGYLNRDDLNHHSFITSPFNHNCHPDPREGSHQISERLYQTGDICRFLPDGNIEFLGRIDNQVKIRGLRIELGEIESTLHQHPKVKNVVVKTAENNSSIIAYVVPQGSLTTGDLQHDLKEKLPLYMIPSQFVFLENLPLTVNGKIDTKALKTPQLETKTLEPTNEIEKAIAHQIKTLLNLQSLTREDNFFEIGGNSLTSMQLVIALKKHLGFDLALSDLFLNPTVASLANHLTKSNPWSPLVAIQAHGNKTPFFCVHPIFGVIFPYYDLAAYLSKDQPFYALQPLGIDGKTQPLTSIEAMATYYIKALRQIQPVGPYFLGGWSSGGLIAFEMAQQLRENHQEVALLALLDAEAPIKNNQPSFWKTLVFLLTQALPSLSPFLLNAIRYKQAETEAIIPILKVYNATCGAIAQYTPKTYGGKITIFQATTSKKDELTMGWGELAAEIQIIDIPGNHLSMLTKPNVESLAIKLKETLSIF